MEQRDEEPAGVCKEMLEAVLRRPDDFNWVEARAKVPRGVYAELVERVEADLKEATRVAADHERPTSVRPCRFYREGLEFYVWRGGGHPVMGGDMDAAAKFELISDTYIEVSRLGDPGESTIVGTPTLQHNGDLAILVDGKVLALWQFSRLVLEPLLFAHV